MKIMTVGSKKPKTLQAIHSQWENCQKCKLSKTRKMLVFGKGFAEATTVLVGEAPGEQEDESGIPFVGKSGLVLDKLLKTGKLWSNPVRDRLKDKHGRVFITNVVMCRPTEKGKNRQPKAAEILACQPRLEEVLNLIRPSVLVFLGRVAESSVMGFAGFSYPMEYSGMRIYQVSHPAVYLRNPDKIKDDLEMWQAISEDTYKMSQDGRRGEKLSLPLMVKRKVEE